MPTQEEVGGPPGFGSGEPTRDADMFSTPPREDHTVDVSDTFPARRLKSLTRVLKKVDSPLIREAPKQPPARPMLPW